jgi:CheY-specific phosphatase CheX
MTTNIELVQLDEKTIIAEVCGAVRHVFATTLELDAAIGEAQLDSPSEQGAENVLALIGWSGQWKGTGMIGCSPHFACRIASLMLGTTYTSLGEDVLDALGEMANQIFGNVKTNLESFLGSMDLGIPTVLYGNNLSARSMVRKAIFIPVTVEGHNLTVKVHMAPNTGQAMRAARLCVNVDLAESPLAL